MQILEAVPSKSEAAHKSSSKAAHFLKLFQLLKVIHLTVKVKQISQIKSFFHCFGLIFHTPGEAAQSSSHFELLFGCRTSFLI